MEKMPQYSKDWNVFERIKHVLQELAPATEGLNEREIQGCLLHIVHLRMGRIKTLTSQERLIYDILLQKGWKAKTLYDWLLLTNAPAHIKDKLRDCKISMKDASSMSYRWRQMISTKAGKEIMNEMQVVIGGLKWKGQEDSKSMI